MCIEQEVNTVPWFSTEAANYFLSRFSTECGQKPSYVHRIGAEPLEYKTIGQLLKETATKYPDRIALVSCIENTRITYAEALEKVIKIFVIE
jgi:hypothetical protein